MDDYCIVRIPQQKWNLIYLEITPDVSVRELVSKLSINRTYMSYIYWNEEIDRLDEYLKGGSQHDCNIHECIHWDEYIPKNYVYNYMRLPKCYIPRINLFVDSKRKYEIRNELILRLKKKKQQRVITLILCKKVCPDVERSISEYL